MSCYQARYYISSLPRHLRTWDSASKSWLVDVRLISRLASDLRDAGLQVIVDDELEQAPDTWADAMFEALPPALADQAGSGHRRAPRG